jgi:hypothetical protein
METDYNRIIQLGIDKVMNSRYAKGAAVGADMLSAGVKGLESQRGIGIEQQKTDLLAANTAHNTGMFGIAKDTLGLAKEKQIYDQRKIDPNEVLEFQKKMKDIIGPSYNPGVRGIDGFLGLK